ncbi:hypothetical protein L1987_84492 [Smallanthus sonchifolius]|uniref:Uncharacterized protein n=1 Tax=Smallanthus sonchifolius TaxID=185202 RepID=A0ACB8YJ29_9ASTR|nr:hypothetical protein L1987_84492 [Smallanthus sonchifolius]
MWLKYEGSKGHSSKIGGLMLKCKYQNDIIIHTRCPTQIARIAQIYDKARWAVLSPVEDQPQIPFLIIDRLKQ